MAPAKKRARKERASNSSTISDDLAKESVSDSVLLTDHRTSWLVGDDDIIELKSATETFKCSKGVLSKHSEYFARCFGSTFKEGIERRVQFDDIDARSLALYIGLAYSHSSIVPHVPPLPDEHPESAALKTSLQDFVSVYNLCDRFVSPVMQEYVFKCIEVCIGDRYRALFRTHADEASQKQLMRDFADSFEALNPNHLGQGKIGETMAFYFASGVSYKAWISSMEEVMDRPKFVAAVSKQFAHKLDTMPPRARRKELKGPPFLGLPR